eukprot:13465073-Alexandrium_andersonii.AAC.1
MLLPCGLGNPGFSPSALYTGMRSLLMQGALYTESWRHSSCSLSKLQVRLGWEPARGPCNR